MGLPAQEYQHERLQCALDLPFNEPELESHVVPHEGSFVPCTCTTIHTDACAVLMAPIVIAALLGVLQVLITNLLSDIGSVCTSTHFCISREFALMEVVSCIVICSALYILCPVCWMILAAYCI